MGQQTEATVTVGVRGESHAIGSSAEPAATSLFDVAKRRPGWPLVLLFVGYPIWWALGIADVVTLVAAAAMAWELGCLRRVRLPVGFGVWLLFLIWVIVGVALVQIDAPGAVAGSSGTRYLTWAWRLLWYLKATVVLLYIGNHRRELSLTWVCRIFGWMFVFIVAGGLLGAVAPSFEFRSLMEVLLPKDFSSITFVNSIIHPVAAESFVTLGEGEGRASAPFAFANVWGLNFACFLPFFVVAWFGRDAGWRRYFGPFILAVACIPVVLSLNRGLWAALIGAMIFVAVQFVLAGRVRLLGVLFTGIALAGALIAVTPLGHTVDKRLHGSAQNSNEGRANLSALGLESMAKTSPLVGLGTTRSVQGNFNSISGGGTAACPRCAVPPLGTQGQFSLVSFTQGIGGAILYFGFLILQFLRHIRKRSEYAIAALAVILIHFITSAVYSADNLAILAVFGALAMLWREGISEDSHDATSDGYAVEEPTPHDYSGAVIEHARSLVALAIVGTLGGAVASHVAGTSYSASVSLVVPADPMYPGQNDLPPTLDTIAQSASSGATDLALQRAAGPGRHVETSALTVTASPNSRILHLKFVADSSQLAQTLVGVAAQSVLATRLADLQSRQQRVIAELQGETSGVVAALRTADLAAAATNAPPDERPLVTALLLKARKANADLAQVEQLPLDGGSIITPIAGHAIRQGRKVDLASGFALGLLSWAVFAVARRSLSPRLRRTRYTTSSRGLRVLEEGPRAELDPESLLMLERPVACIAIGTQHHALAAAADLDSRIPNTDRGASRGRVILVAARGDRVRPVIRARRTLERSGAEVAGLVIIDRGS